MTLSAKQIEKLEDALDSARLFIKNGIEFGRIRMPGPADTALETPVKIEVALALLREAKGGGGRGITLAQLQKAHIERQEEWCPDQKPDLSFRGNELAGEVGETIEALYDHIAELGKAAGRSSNIIKKLEREHYQWRGSRATKEQLAQELSDIIHCTVLVAITAGIELDPEVIAKFNATSEKNGLATMLSAAPSAPASDGWRDDMENAPRDGKSLLVWPSVWSNADYDMARWDDDRYAKKPRPFFKRAHPASVGQSRETPPQKWFRPAAPTTGSADNG